MSAILDRCTVTAGASLIALALLTAGPTSVGAQETPADEPAPNGASAGGEASAPGAAESESETSHSDAANAPAQMGEWHSSMSLIADMDGRPEFERYSYVNPDAPVGGTLNQVAAGSFDSFNPFIVRGTPAAGFSVVGGGLIYDTLMDQSLDEPGTSHPLIAEAVRYPDDYSSATFRIDPDARWHDGEPITPEDVVWSFDTLTDLHPFYNAYYRNVERAEVTGDNEVTFTFSETNNRELPHIMGDLTVLPEHYWTAEGRDITRPVAQPPLGSGPYEVERFDPGQSITWVRAEDYWAADKPTRIGRFNYGRIDYTYFRDQNAAWEAFKKGGLEDYRVENRAQRWQEGYTFPAARNGQVVKKTFPLDRIQPMQTFVINSRLDKFSDRRVREALTLAFNFQQMNRQLFYGAYTRLDSYFENSDLESTGLPQGEELAILEPLRGKIPDEVFTEEFTLPDYSQPNAERTYLREANQLLLEAGYERRGTRLVNAETGEPLSITFLGNDPNEERIFAPFQNALQRLGIAVSIDIADPNQYVERIRNFDFEITTDQFAQSESPGNEQRDFWSSRAAETPGSRNTAGIANPAVDQLIEDIIYADDRETLVAATRALDRVLKWEYYTIPQWFSPEVRLAYWDRIELPKDQPDYAGIDPFSWWVAGAGDDTAAAGATNETQTD